MYASLSPSKLNKELNKILETERMIKEYKEMITKMQRDLYSKKESQTNASDGNSEIKKKKKQSLDKTSLSMLQRKRIF